VLILSILGLHDENNDEIKCSKRKLWNQIPSTTRLYYKVGMLDCTASAKGNSKCHKYRERQFVCACAPPNFSLLLLLEIGSLRNMVLEGEYVSLRFLQIMRYTLWYNIKLEQLLALCRCLRVTSYHNIQPAPSIHQGT